MNTNRFSDEQTLTTDRITPQFGTGFLMVPVAAAELAQQSPLQSLYQRIYEQAQQVNQAPRTRDLFAVMN
jgi:hypothetical protein